MRVEDNAWQGWLTAALVLAEVQQHQQPSTSDMDAVMQAAAAAERMKSAFTINEQELLALRPALLKGFAYMQQQRR